MTAISQAEMEAGTQASPVLIVAATVICVALLVVSLSQMWWPPLRRWLTLWLERRELDRHDRERVELQRTVDQWGRP